MQGRKANPKSMKPEQAKNTTSQPERITGTRPVFEFEIIHPLFQSCKQEPREVAIGIVSTICTCAHHATCCYLFY
jgi:hypothetical protein